MSADPMANRRELDTQAPPSTGDYLNAAAILKSAFGPPLVGGSYSKPTGRHHNQSDLREGELADPPEARRRDPANPPEARRHDPANPPEARRRDPADPPEARRRDLANPPGARRRDPADLLVRQRGLVRRGQLDDAGWTCHQIDHEIDVGRWRQLAPEVFVVQTGPLTDEQRQWLGVLHAGTEAALSHGTACSRSGLKGWQSDVVDVITRKGQAIDPIPGFFFHQTRRPYVQWLQPGSSPPRLRLEIAALLRAEREGSLRAGIGLLAAVVQQRLSTTERLLLSSFEISKLRHGKQLRLALGDIAGGAQSFAEIDLGRICREYDLQPPRRQVLRRDRHGRRRYLDCEWELPDGTVVVLEIDGGFHLETENWWRDMRRERGVVISGRLVLRCSNIEIRLAPAEIMQDLMDIGVPRRTQI